mgnify:CR=1 FL=1
MSIIKSNMTAPPPAAAGGGALSRISEMNSLRFDGSSYLGKQWQQPYTSQTMTYSCWVKFSDLSTTNTVLWAGTSPSDSSNDDGFDFYLNSARVFTNSGNGSIGSSSAKFRDTSSWYHFVMTADPTNGFRIYVNGNPSPINTVGGFGNHNFNNNSSYAAIGAQGTSPSLKGYLANIHLIDGQALDASHFGEEISGTWVPKQYDPDTSGAYGANGFHLDFSNRGGHTVQTINNVQINTSSSSGYIDDAVPSALSPTNQALAFVGDSYLRVAPWVDLSGDFTLETWFSLSASNHPTNSSSMYMFTFDGNVTSGKELYMRTNQKTFSFWDENTVHDFGSYDHTSSTWQHLAFVRESGNISCYLNGSKLGSSYNQGANFSGNRIHIGDDFLGGMNHIRVSNVARYTGASISDWQNTTHNFTTDSNTLLLITDQNNIDDTTFVDQSGSGDVSIGYDSSGNNNHWDVN